MSLKSTVCREGHFSARLRTPSSETLVPRKPTVFPSGDGFALTAGGTFSFNSALTASLSFSGDSTSVRSIRVTDNKTDAGIFAKGFAGGVHASVPAPDITNLDLLGTRGPWIVSARRLHPSHVWQMVKGCAAGGGRRIASRCSLSSSLLRSRRLPAECEPSIVIQAPECPECRAADIIREEGGVPHKRRCRAVLNLLWSCLESS